VELEAPQTLTPIIKAEVEGPHSYNSNWGSMLLCTTSDNDLKRKKS